jgi:hypothetical protein
MEPGVNMCDQQMMAQDWSGATSAHTCVCRYLKSPPFSEMNFLASGGPMEANIGIVYVQNAAPDGPVAWMFAEVTDRILR